MDILNAEKTKQIQIIFNENAREFIASVYRIDKDEFLSLVKLDRFVTSTEAYEWALTDFQTLN